MYCAYTIPGMTGSSLMYYYNGKAVRRASIFLLSSLFSPGRNRVRVRERERKRCEGEECRLFTHQL
uniref:Uncharacterized protein n=1 Tax=Acanthochromis polyacanthus TaxID=80966 RepID=A0A3Q1G0W8_9TELE